MTVTDSPPLSKTRAGRTARRLSRLSPLAWLPIVTMVVSALYIGVGGLPKSFVTSAITVTLCSLWPTLINTALGVASIDKDLVSVGRVLKLGPWKRITRLVLPSALPLIFTGMRLSLGVGWMVLIAAEMLAQTRANVAAEIEAIWTADRRSAVLVTNDVDEALVLADRIVCLNPDGSPTPWAGARSAGWQTPSSAILTWKTPRIGRRCSGSGARRGLRKKPA